MNIYRNWRVTIPFLQGGQSATPNSRSGDESKRLRDYFQAMYVTFASLRRFNSDLDLSLISNQRLPDPYATLIENIGVRTLIVPFEHLPSTDMKNPFGASLYYLDALANLEECWNILLDPDVLCTATLSFLEEFPSNHLGGMVKEYEPEQPVNGLSRHDAQKLHVQLDQNGELPTYYGGEIYIIPPSFLMQSLELAETAWQFSNNQSRAFQPYFHTEEHIFNYILSKFPVYPLNNTIKRIWTTHRYRNVSGIEQNVPLWHLPAEKGRGFKEVFQASMDENSWFWKASQSKYVAEASKSMGLSHRKASRWLPDQMGALVNLAAGKI